jgi:hypothetical protein
MKKGWLASALMGARSPVGMGALPFNFAVEIDLIVEVA